jgi:LacI family transcriptional regulator
MATIRDVARLASVSTATVSATINQSAYVSPELQSRVWEAIERVGYEPDAVARSLRKGQTRLLGLIVADITNPYTTAIVHSMEAAAHARGYTLTLCNSDEDSTKEETYLRLLRTHRADGIILMPSGTGADYAARIERLVKSHLVLVDRTVPGLPYDSVTTDGAAGTEAAIDHIIALGHRRIAIVTGPKEISTSESRLTGYRRALSKHDIAFDSALVHSGDFRQDLAYAAARVLLSQPRPPTAIFASNNLMAIGVMRAVTDMGLRCPQTVSVACFDDFEWATAFHPRLTTVAQPTDAIGAHAIEMLLDRLTGLYQGPPRHTVLRPQLVIRDSCVPPAGEGARG